MIITGAFFAREASVAEGGLSATGAVWDYYMLSPHGEFHGMTLVVLLQAIPEQSRHQSVQVEIYAVPASWNSASRGSSL